LIGEIGTVQETLEPEGIIFIHGELWRAKAKDVIKPGEKVQVEEMHGLLLKVKKAEEEQLS
jgi:membrane-bound serine protease (ClpP class)